MDHERTERYDAAAGIAFVLLALAATLITGFDAPVVTDPVADVREFLVDKRDEIQASTYLIGLSTIAFLVFLGTLRGRLLAAEGGTGRLTVVAFGSGLVVVALALVGSALGLAATLHTEELGNAGVRGLWDAQAYVYAMIAFPVAALTASSGRVILNTGALPRAVGALGVVTAVVSILSGLSLYGEDDSFLSIGGAGGFVAFFLFLAWVVAMSIVLMREGPAPAAAPAAARDA